ncbi:MAG: type II toxin-antitoxin system RelE/ParE family toxin, partial [Treponema sp.]
MKFKVEKLPAVESEISVLKQPQKDLLETDYEKIEQQGIEFVKVKPLQKKIYEIKSNDLRSLFKYKEGRIIIIGVVFVKKTQKTPKDIINNPDASVGAQCSMFRT